MKRARDGDGIEALKYLRVSLPRRATYGFTALRPYQSAVATSAEISNSEEGLWSIYSAKY
jgi:hypothetical protein